MGDLNGVMPGEHDHGGAEIHALGPPGPERKMLK